MYISFTMHYLPDYPLTKQSTTKTSIRQAEQWVAAEEVGLMKENLSKTKD